jgi:hypothetical protein
MSSLTSTPTDPEHLRPLVHADIDRLPATYLSAVHRLLLELELDEVSDRLDAGFDADRAAGKLAELPDIIRAARASLRERAAS